MAQLWTERDLMRDCITAWGMYRGSVWVRRDREKRSEASSSMVEDK